MAIRKEWCNRIEQDILPESEWWPTSLKFDEVGASQLVQAVEVVEWGGSLGTHFRLFSNLGDILIRCTGLHPEEDQCI